MIPQFWSTLSFLFPFALFALPLAVGLLVYAYRKRGRATTRVVGTLFLLKLLPQKTTAHRKFVPPPRFYFELFLLLLLFIGGAGIFRRGDGEKIALIIDNAFHLKARIGGSEGGRQIFDLVRQEADSYLQSLPSHVDIDLYTGAPHFQLVQRELSPSSAAKALESLKTVYSEGELKSGIERALRNPLYKKVAVVTDYHIDLKDNLVVGEKLVSRTIPRQKSIQNIAVVGVSATLTESRTVSVDLISFADEQIRGELRLEGADEIVREGRTPLATLKSIDVTLTPKKIATFSFTQIPKSLPILKLTFTSDPGPLVDAIEDDNSAWIGNSAPANDIGVVTRLNIKELGLDRLRSFRFQVVSEEELRKIERGEKPSARPLLIHGVPIESLPTSSTLFVDPPPGNTLFPVKERYAKGLVTRWLTSHPALTYLTVPSLTMREFSVFSGTNWTRELILTNEGPTGLVGEQGGHRYAVLGFDLFPFQGKDSPTLSILTMNLLKWISDASTQDLSLRPFVGVPLSSTVTRLRTVEGDLLYEGGKRESPIIVERPTALIMEGSDLSVIPVNFFSESESDTLRERTLPLDLSALRTTREETDQVSNTVMWWLALITLLLLTLDLLYLLLKRFRHRGEVVS